MAELVPPVTVEDFRLASALSATASAAPAGPWTNPETLAPVPVDLGGGEVVDVSFNNKPLTRGIVAVVEEFGEQAENLMMRGWALLELGKREEFKPYFVTIGGTDGVRDELMEVAATYECDFIGGFEPVGFLKAVQEKMKANDG